MKPFISLGAALAGLLLVLAFLSRPEDFSTFADETKVLALVEVHASKAA